jgi:hypothetical protein
MKIRQHNSKLKPFKLKLTGRPLTTREVAKKYGLPMAHFRSVTTFVAKSNGTLTDAVRVAGSKANSPSSQRKQLRRKAVRHDVLLKGSRRAGRVKSRRTT